MKAAKRNATEKFTGEVSIRTHPDGEVVGNRPKIPITKKNNFRIGSGGDQGCGVPEAQWAIDVKKKTYSPFSLKKPEFTWTLSRGDSKGNRSGVLSRYGKSASAVVLCGQNRQNLSHKVNIILNKKK